MKTIKVRIPVIVTADGKWAAQGSHHDDPANPDWSVIDEMCDWENPTVMPMRHWVEADIQLPETETYLGAVSE